MAEEICVQYRDLLIQKRYSVGTRRIYLKYFCDFVAYFKDHRLNDITYDEINRYLLWLVENQDISASQQNQRINAIKFYYEKVLGREKQVYTMHRPRKSQPLPKVLSKREVTKILDACK